MKNKKNFDLIIPVYRPDEKLHTLLQRMEKQSVLPEHIFLMHTAVPPFDEELRKRYGSHPRIRIVELTPEEFDHGGTRNWGASLSKADYIMFMTQDAIPLGTGLTERMLDGFLTDKVAAVYARQVCAKDAGVLEAYTRQFNYPKESRVKSLEDLERLGIKTYFCSNVCAAYDRQVYQEQGGFVTKTIFNEDMIFAAGLIQAGYKISYRADCLVEHSHRYTGWQQLSRNFDLGVSQQQYRQIFDGVKSETEGIRLVKDTAKWLFFHGKVLLVPELIVQSGCKYVGYRLGKSYEKLPLWLCRRLSMNKKFWNEETK
jgi:rhamnosyltransferase